MSAAIEIKAEELDEVLAYIDKFAGAMSGRHGDTAPWLQYVALPASYRSDDQKWFGTTRNRVRQRGVR